MPQVKIIIVMIVIYSGALGGNKIWLSMHLRNFGPDKIARTYMRPHLHVSRGKIHI